MEEVEGGFASPKLGNQFANREAQLAEPSD
jgi:hypothetical protein